jgi:formate dehydrogenase major subunit
VSNPTTYAQPAVNGSEWVNELLYREICTPSAGGGTVWIYTGAYDTVRTTNRHLNQTAPWPVDNRSKSRDRSDPNNTLASPAWGYSWLVNRRVLYNNNSANPGTAIDEVPGDVQDFFMGLDSCSRLFTSTGNPPTRTAFNYPRWYRTIQKLSDRPDVVLAASTNYNPTSPHFVGSVSYAGRFPAHTEPYESPAPAAMLAKYGYNTRGVQGDLLPAGTLRGTSATYPLVLTTIRCVEHFQGGPITRNNPYNVEQEPVPWIELNGVDARNAGIRDGDWVKIVTARTDGYTNDRLDSDPNLSRAAYGQGFQARVGTGTTENQRVAPGVVAIPWHWGEQGLSTGSRANDLTIDANDANTTIPEYKACLCRIEKI